MLHTPAHTYLHTVSPLALTPHELFNQSHGWTVWTVSLIGTCCVHFKCLTLYLTDMRLYVRVCKYACGKAVKETWKKLLISYNRVSWLRKHKFYFLWDKTNNFSTLTSNIISNIDYFSMHLKLLTHQRERNMKHAHLFFTPFLCT